MDWNSAAPLLWVTLALVNAGLAETKNRSRWNWFVMSMFTGPVATFLIVTWPRRDVPISAPDREPFEARRD